MRRDRPRDQGGDDHARGRRRRRQPEPDPARGDRRQGDRPHRPADPRREHVAGVHHPISICRMAVGDAYGAEQWREAEGDDELAHRTETIRRSDCRAVAEFAFREAERLGGRVYGGPKWTVSPVYEGMLKEEMDAAAERHPDMRLRAGADRRDARRTRLGRRRLAARDPLPQPRRRPALRPRPAAVRLDRGRRVGAAGARRRAQRRRVAMAEAPHGTAPALEGKDVANPMAMILAGAAVLHYAGDRRPSARRGRSTRRSLETVAAGIRRRPRRPRRDDRVHRRGDRRRLDWSGRLAIPRVDSG